MHLRNSSNENWRLFHPQNGYFTPKTKNAIIVPKRSSLIWFYRFWGMLSSFMHLIMSSNENWRLFHPPKMDISPPPPIRKTQLLCQRGWIWYGFIGFWGCRVQLCTLEIRPMKTDGYFTPQNGYFTPKTKNAIIIPPRRFNYSGYNSGPGHVGSRAGGLRPPAPPQRVGPGRFGGHYSHWGQVVLQALLSYIYGS